MGYDDYIICVSYVSVNRLSCSGALARVGQAAVFIDMYLSPYPFTGPPLRELAPPSPADPLRLWR